MNLIEHIITTNSEHLIQGFKTVETKYSEIVYDRITCKFWYTNATNSEHININVSKCSIKLKSWIHMHFYTTNSEQVIFSGAVSIAR